MGKKQTTAQYFGEFDYYGIKTQFDFQHQCCFPLCFVLLPSFSYAIFLNVLF